MYLKVNYVYDVVCDAWGSICSSGGSGYMYMHSEVDTRVQVAMDSDNTDIYSSIIVDKQMWFF